MRDAHAELLRYYRRGENRALRQDIQHLPSQRPRSGGDQAVPLFARGSQLACKPRSALRRCYRTLGEQADHRFDLATTVRAQRVKIPSRISKQPNRDGKCRCCGDSPRAHDDVDKRPPGATVTVCKRVNRLKLGVDNSRLRKRRQICALHESLEVAHRIVEVTVVGRNEVGIAWMQVAAADPHLLLPQLARDRGS